MSIRPVLADRQPGLPLVVRSRTVALRSGRIDALIDKKRLMADLLRQRADQSLAVEMSDYGFNFPAELSPEWSEVSIPRDWRILRLSQVLVQLTNGFVGPTRDILVESGVPYIQSLHIKNGEIAFERRPFFVRPEWHEARPRIHLGAGDVLIVQTGDIGKVAVVPQGYGPASCHALQIARVRTDLVSGPFLAEYLRTPFGYESLLSRATGALHPHLEGGIKDVPVILPPKSVQELLLQRVRKDRERQKELQDLLAKQLIKLQEHRQALITAAVTGELEIPGARR